nr:unnamed protein product [Spirometra erinaceieuropaei]
MERLNSLEATSKRDEDDSLRFAFSLPCSPTPGFQPVMERRKSSSLSSLSRPMFYLNASNGSHIVLKALKKLDWTRCADRNSEHCVMKWTETVLQVNYQLFKEGELMVNHIPNCGLLTNKLGMLMSLRQYEYACRNSSTGVKKKFIPMKDFVPETYCIDDARDRVQFLSILRDGQVWIYKPSGMNQGKGIQLIRGKADFEKLQEDCVEEWRRNPGSVRPRILQRYIDKPLLLDGRKFDIRCYLLIVSSMPFLVLFHPGYVRVCTRKYDVNSPDLLVHLTNQYIQKKDPNYSKLKEDTVWSMDRFNEYINAHYVEEKKIEKDWAKTTLMASYLHIIS